MSVQGQTRRFVMCGVCTVHPHHQTFRDRVGTSCLGHEQKSMNSPADPIGRPLVASASHAGVKLCWPPLTDRERTGALGKLRALAITTATRSEALPDIPTVGESVPGYEASSFFGVGAPRNTPAEMIDKLNKEIDAGLADPKIKVRLADLDGTVLGGSPADFGKLIAEETEKWGKVVRAANIKPK
jgi:hypothetical protein